MYRKYNLGLFLGIIALLVLLISSCKSPNKIGELNVDITEFKNVPTSGDTLKMLVTSSEDFTIHPQVDWITSNTETNSSRIRVTLNVQPNSSGQERTGTVLVKTQSKEVKVTVQQLSGDVNMDDYVYQIPVIFHVLYNEEEEAKLIAKNDEYRKKNFPIYEKLNSQKLQELIAQVNKIYRGDPTPPTNSIDRANYELDRTVMPNANVEFVLASEDKDGTKLTNLGIKRYAITETALNPDDVMNDEQGGKYHNMALPISETINIFVFPFKSESTDLMTLGISHFPHVPSAYPLEGLGTLDVKIKYISNYNHCVVLNSKMFEPEVYMRISQGPSVAYFTLAHELGHSLGLRHVFAEAENAEGTSLDMVDECIESDFCGDTQTYNRIKYQNTRPKITNYQNPYPELQGLRKRTNCSSVVFTSTNIMDYNESWNDRMTAEQVKRLRHVLYYSFDVPGGVKLATPNAQTKSMGSVVVKPMKTNCPEVSHRH